MRLIEDIKISHMYLQLHFLLYTGTSYCAVRIFKKLPTGIAGKKMIRVFQSALRKYFLAHMFYCKE